MDESMMISQDIGLHCFPKKFSSFFIERAFIIQGKNEKRAQHPCFVETFGIFNGFVVNATETTSFLTELSFDIFKLFRK